MHTRREAAHTHSSTPPHIHTPRITSRRRGRRPRHRQDHQQRRLPASLAWQQLSIMVRLLVYFRFDLLTSLFVWHGCSLDGYAWKYLPGQLPKMKQKQPQSEQPRRQDGGPVTRAEEACTAWSSGGRITSGAQDLHPIQ